MWWWCKQLLALLLFAGLDYNHLVILQEDSLSNLTYHPNHSVIANSALKLNIVNLTNLQVWYSSTHFQSMEPFLLLGKPFRHLWLSLCQMELFHKEIWSLPKITIYRSPLLGSKQNRKGNLKLTLTLKYRDCNSSAWSINLIYYRLSAPW